jgi:hypothetical protein
MIRLTSLPATDTKTPPLSLLRERLCRNARIAHTCHLERSERSCIFSYMRRKDFSLWARNDNWDTVSERGGRRGVVKFLFRFWPGIATLKDSLDVFLRSVEIIDKAAVIDAPEIVEIPQ